MARPEIRPSVGFCIQTDSLGTPAGRWYLNMTKHSLVEMPISHSGKVISREFILGHGIGSCKIPFDMGSFRKLKERAEGARHTAYCVDAVFNPFIVNMFMDDAFNETMKEYRPFIINLVLQRIESSIGVKLSTQKVKLVKKFLYKDGEGHNGDEPRELTDLPQEIEPVEEVQPPPRPAAPAEPEEPLIQDVTPNKKPAMKKGFLNKASAALYPEGSNEGVLPENAGDPLGYLPKRLRNTCKVVDCNAPEYQANEKKRQDVEKANKDKQEFNDLLMSDLNKWNKPGNVWAQDDVPEGSEISATQKYEVDYSRFDKLADVDDDNDQPVAENRDWYYDEKGVPRKHVTKANPVTANHSGEVESEPAIKKGFFDNVKAPLYPKGSEQRAPLSEADECSKMLESLGGNTDLLNKMFGEEGLPGFPQPQEKPQAKEPKPTVTAKVPETKVPEFKLERDDNEGLLQLMVDVPGLESMKGVDLDVTESHASLAFPSSIGLRPLKIELPSAVVPTSVKAKFSKKTHQITVKLPLLLQVAKAG